VNSAAWEWDPRISTTFISFFRNRVTNGVRYADLFLYRRETRTLRRIASLRFSRFTVDGSTYLWNGSVGDRYATWTGCVAPDVDCEVWVYDSVARTTSVIHGGGDRQEYAGALDEAKGFIYLARSGNACGLNVAVWRIALDSLQGTPTKVAEIPDGYDVGYEASINVNGITGETDYYFSRAYCRQNSNDDIFVAAGVDTA
jgi:hypothetical protein